MPRTIRDTARDAFADALQGQGRQWASAAGNVRAGYSNVWIEAGIDAVETALRRCGDDEAEETTGRRA